MNGCVAKPLFIRCINGVEILLTSTKVSATTSRHRPAQLWREVHVTDPLSSATFSAQSIKYGGVEN